MNTAIVTGANTGLGFECARALAETGNWHVVVACRSAEKGRAAVTRLIEQTKHESIEAMPLDLASLESVRSFAPHFAAWRRPPLRALVCNAATQIVTGRTFTVDGFETTFAVSHLGHFLLVQLMLPQMAPPARIVVRQQRHARPGADDRDAAASVQIRQISRAPPRRSEAS